MNQLYEEEIKRLEEERATLIATGCTEPPSIDYDAVWVRIAGGRKKGRVYGRGKVPSRLKPPVYDFDDFSTAKNEEKRAKRLKKLVEEKAEQNWTHRVTFGPRSKRELNVTHPTTSPTSLKQQQATFGPRLNVGQTWLNKA
ncbi:hypothetical protein PIB30_066095 [Stylosanthes scabra]|uniref:Uncharacterized protein n=1 Tax=Stylosanthes scabra TaxID=79078 RepID=A0ABU6QM35_9FABA|nr:hypothetical protein [Stylosanthes scabra]